MPITISQNKTVHRAGDLPVPQFTVSGATPAAWTTNAGTVSPTPALTTILTPPNRTRAVIVTATVGAETAQATIQIEGVFPLTPDWGYKVREVEPAKVSVAEDEVTRRVRYKGPWYQVFELSCPDRSLIDETEYVAFRRWQRLHLPFWFYDIAKEVLIKVTFDTLESEVERISYDGNNITCLLKEWR